MKIDQSVTRRYAQLLWFFTILFSMRVIAQFLQFSFGTELLPSFDKWQGSSIPYPMLLFTQCLILFIQIRLNRRIGSGSITARHVTGKILLALGALYFISMSGRLILGQTLYMDNAWFAQWIPAVFHMVLAAYVLILGRYHFRFGKGLT